MTVVQPALAPPRIVSEKAPDGSRILRSEEALEPYEASLGVLLRRWAEEAPDRVFLAERPGDGDWVELTWGDANRKATAIAQALLDRGLGPDRPLAILSGNSIDHALLTLGGFLAGVPVVPVSPAYSLMSQDYGKVKHIAALVKPGLVYAADAGPFGGVLSSVDFGGAEIVLSKGTGATPFSTLLDTAPTGAVDEALSKVGPDSLAKVLFTSGSTAQPKGVLNTHGMLCANQQSLAQVWPFTAETPPVLVDWLPWNHTFGGNHNFNLILKRGGTMYIDAGRPAPPLIPITVRNLTEIAPTIYFNVPAGYGALLPFLERDENLRARFFERLDLIFYAAAALPQDLWTRLEAVVAEARGEPVMMTSSWGLTETSPLATAAHFPIDRAGVIGVPVPGVEIKLTPVEGKLEMRVKGPNVTRGLPRGAGADREGVRRRRLVPHGRRGQARGRGRPEQGPRVRRPRGRGLQAHHGHLRVGRQPADRGAGGGLAAADGRRRLRPRPRLRLAAGLAATSARRRSSRASRTRRPRTSCARRSWPSSCASASSPTTAPTPRPRRAWSA